MIETEKLVAKVPTAQIKDGIRWLVLQIDASSRGWLLFGHRSLKEPSSFDSWHLNKQDALKEAELQWRVDPSIWRTVIP
jgi:hypothetical protein